MKEYDTVKEIEVREEIAHLHLLVLDVDDLAMIADEHEKQQTTDERWERFVDWIYSDDGHAAVADLWDRFDKTK